MNVRLKTGFFLFFIFLLAGCSPHIVPATPELPATPTSLSIPSGLTQEQFITLSSLRKVDNYPLYTMTYSGAYRPREAAISLESFPAMSATVPGWAYSLFAVLLDENNLLYDRNFDWQFSPALMLFTDPPDG